jgi:PST family polysaccharide transporter
VSTAPEPDGAGAGPGSEPSLSTRTVRATPWRSGSLFAQGALQFAFGVVLARLLSPQEFGIAALALVAVGFIAALAELGQSASLIYLRRLTGRHIRVSFTLSVLVAAGLGGALALLASPLAWLLGEPVLTGVLRAEAPLFLLTAAGTPARALLHRRMDFRRLFLIEVGGYVGGYAVIAVVLAARGFGVWSLVAALLAQAGLTSLLALALSPYPMRPLLARAEARELVGYGAVSTLNALVGYGSRSADNLVVGRLLGTFDLGLYYRAYNVITVPLSYLGTALTGVLFPAMSEIRADTRRLRSAYLLSVQVTAMLAAPLCAWVLVAAPYLITGLYGPRWEAATTPLRILAAGGMLRAVYHVAAALTYASANVMAEVRRQVIFTLFVIGGGVIGANWGIGGVAGAVLLAMTFMYVAMAHLSLRIVAGTWRDFLRAQLPGLGLGLFVALSASLLRAALASHVGSDVAMLVGLTVGAPVSFALGVYLLPAGLRPGDLFSRVGLSVGGWPAIVRLPLGRILRVRV